VAISLFIDIVAVGKDISISLQDNYTTKKPTILTR